MFDLSDYSYDVVLNFLEKNYKKIEKKSCVDYEYVSSPKMDLYELIIVSLDDKYFDDPNENDVLFKNCHYYILNFNDETYFNELSVIDCGGYYIAVCIFKNKINITNQIFYKNNSSNNNDYNNDDPNNNNYFTKFKMNTFVGNKYTIIPKNFL